MVEQFRVAADNDLVILFVAEGDPSGPVRQGIAVRLDRHPDRCAHAGAGFPVPVAGKRVRRQLGVFPQSALFLVSTAVVAARHEYLPAVLEGLQSLVNGRCTDQTRWIRGGADNHEVIVHEVEPLRAIAIFDKFKFRRLRMDQQNIGIAVRCILDGLSGTYGDDIDAQAGFLLEQGDQIVVKARVLGGGRRLDEYAPLAGRCGGR